MEKTAKIGIYHKNCTDGTTAAAVLLRKFPDIKHFPIVHSEEDINEVVEKVCEIAEVGAEIYFVDIASGAEKLLKEGYKAIVLDHHTSLREKMENLDKENENLTYVFDNDKSGASLTWSHFFSDEDVPDIIKHVEDSDLWKGEFEDTKYVTNYLSTNADTPEKMLEFIESGNIEEIKEKGKIIADYADVQMSRFVEKAEGINIQIGDLVVSAYNLTSSEYASVIGNRLSALNERTTVMFSIKDNSVRFSLRSKDGQSPNALGIAKLLDGGGHENSAGAEVPLKDFIKMIVI